MTPSPSVLDFHLYSLQAIVLRIFCIESQAKIYNFDVYSN